jgi:hypothetical protein
MALPKAFLEDGKFLTVFVSTIADITKPTVAELKTPLVALSDYLTANGFKITHSQDFANDDREASPAVGQIPGQEKYTDGSLEVIDNTNIASEANVAVEKLTKGTHGYIVRRRGKDNKEPFTADDIVSVYAVTIGIKTPVAHAANARQMSTISFSADPNSQDETAKVAA